MARVEKPRPFEDGGVAQLGEHLFCTQGVRSSILLISTIGVEVRETPVKWAYSSVGSSTRLISVRSVVQVHLGPPGGDFLARKFFEN